MAADIAKWCSHDQPDRNITTAEIQEVRGEMIKLVMNQPMQVMAQCKKPCVNINIALIKTWLKENMPKENSIALFPNNEEFIVHIRAYSYDMFNLVVDLGSSLGLWLGLSALSIFDALLEHSRDNLLPFIRKLTKVDKH